MITPIGIAIGIAVTEGSNIEGSPSVAILQALAAGTLIYVVFFEVLEKERPKRHHSTEGGLETKSKKLHQLYGVIQVSTYSFLNNEHSKSGHQKKSRNFNFVFSLS